ncbi:hypothetical protein SAMN04487969_13754 [Paenibacillus algorifonticola]|uniref:Uncharacterized protein n=1 Tax=Paenibacillus algorifonticola TaxID=684063 RepID=A0A1I2IM40_9BACL|nr:hypothetical protein [Paenibacillus algorifonticola]SFF42703.1 hypothetical protein SAMN04487969_13754 [Paenibacillus algorifonticola]
MLERVIVLVLVYGSMLLYDRMLLKNESNKREKSAYIFILLVSFYMGIDYVANLNFFGFFELVDVLLTNPARAIDKWLTMPPK